MKEINELNIPEDVRYSNDHEWAKVTGDKVRIGVSDYAQDQMGDIVFVEIPEVGDTFEAGDEFGTLESVKAVSELYTPIGGEVVAVNDALGEAPELINQDPYGCWIMEIRPENIEDMQMPPCMMELQPWRKPCSWGFGLPKRKSELPFPPLSTLIFVRWWSPVFVRLNLM
jgi:glycine cleavage system H protein